MDLNFPPTPPQPDSGAYQNASVLPPAPASADLQPQPAIGAPLIPVLRKPRIRVGRLLILIFGLLVVLALLSYGGFRSYRFFADRKEAKNTATPTVQFLPLTVYLSEVPFLFTYDTSWVINLPTKTSPLLRINPRS